MKFTKTVRTRIPAWANTIILVANGIDGTPPTLPATMTVKAFLRQAKDLQNRDGAGEWNVLVYAASADIRYPLTTVHPYGNSYRRLRKAPHSPGRFKLITEWSYMRWARHLFTHA